MKQQCEQHYVSEAPDVISALTSVSPALGATRTERDPEALSVSCGAVNIVWAPSAEGVQYIGEILSPVPGSRERPETSTVEEVIRGTRLASVVAHTVGEAIRRKVDWHVDHLGFAKAIGASPKPN